VLLVQQDRKASKVTLELLVLLAQQVRLDLLVQQV
jgi:hypothetical protein